MSEKRATYETLAMLARDPYVAEEEIGRLLGLLRIVSKRLEAGAELEALDLLRDFQGRALMAQALPGWEWGEADPRIHV